jgi:hypothetical protein
MKSLPFEAIEARRWLFIAAERVNSLPMGTPLGPTMTAARSVSVPVVLGASQTTRKRDALAATTGKIWSIPAEETLNPAGSNTVPAGVIRAP